MTTDIIDDQAFPTPFEWLHENAPPAVIEYCDGLISAKDLALAEVERLTRLLAEREQVGTAIMRCAVGRDAPLSDSDVCGEIECLRHENAKLRKAVTELQDEIDAARQEAFSYGYIRDCDEDDPEAVAEADNIISLVSWIAQSESEARAESDGAYIRLADLQAIVEQYPKTGNGKSITPNMPLWIVRPGDGEIYESAPIGPWPPQSIFANRGIEWSDCFDSREAAVEARDRTVEDKA